MEKEENEMSLNGGRAKPTILSYGFGIVTGAGNKIYTNQANFLAPPSSYQEEMFYLHTTIGSYCA